MTDAPPIDILLAYKRVAVVMFLVIPIVCVAIGYALLRSRRVGTRGLWLLVVVSALPILVLTLAPSGNNTDVGCTVQVDAPTLGRIELVANIALFVPLAFIATLATRRPFLVLAAASGLSAIIEGVQAVAPVIGRACDTNDWLMNTLGAIVGVLLACGTIAIAGRTRVKTAGDTD